MMFDFRYFAKIGCFMTWGSNLTAKSFVEKKKKDLTTVDYLFLLADV